MDGPYELLRPSQLIWVIAYTDSPTRHNKNTKTKKGTDYSEKGLGTSSTEARHGEVDEKRKRLGRKDDVKDHDSHKRKRTRCGV